jgi:hypothetical protein
MDAVFVTKNRHAGRRLSFTKKPAFACTITVRNKPKTFDLEGCFMAGAVGAAGGYGFGAFGGYTRWAVVFLIIFVLFFLLVPYGVDGVY